MLLNEAIDKHISWHNSLALLFDTQKFEIHLSYEYIMPHNKLTFIYSCFGNLFLRKCLEPSEFHTFWYNDQTLVSQFPQVSQTRKSSPSPHQKED